MSKNYRSPSNRHYHKTHLQHICYARGQPHEPDCPVCKTVACQACTVEIRQTRQAVALIAPEGRQVGPIQGYHGDGKLGRHHAAHLNAAKPYLKSRRWASTTKYPYHRKIGV